MSIARLNYLNIGLMLAAAGTAFVVPFELFLVSYAVLGPLHYLTELSWLHDRKYFALHWREVVGLAALAVLAVLITGYFHVLLGTTPDSLTIRLSNWSAEIALAGLGVACIAVTLQSSRARYLGLGMLLVVLVGAHYADKHADITIYSIVLNVYLATIIHVFVFTGAFLLYGSLKTSSRSGYVSCIVFLACAIGCVYVPSSRGYALSDEDVAAYRMTSFVLLHTLAYHLPFVDHGAIAQDPAATFLSGDAVRVGRFISFAYTYHYLNWFSKTSIIRWHDVPRVRFIAVIVLWLLALALYAHEYRTGLAALFGLSLLHVYMEFPLYWRSFLGIGQELGARLRRRP